MPASWHSCHLSLPQWPLFLCSLKGRGKKRGRLWRRHPVCHCHYPCARSCASHSRMLCHTESKEKTLSKVKSNTSLNWLFKANLRNNSLTSLAIAKFPYTTLLPPLLLLGKIHPLSFDRCYSCLVCLKCPEIYIDNSGVNEDLVPFFVFLFDVNNKTPNIENMIC